MPIEQSLTQTIDEWAQQTYPADGPGAAVIAVRDGEVLYRQGHGLAHLELGVPIEPDMVFRIGSITKQFTAVAILMLAEQGGLALDDPLTKFLPDYPTHDHTITIEHLLTHIAGIKSYTSMPEWPPVWRKDFTVAEMIDFFKDQPMDFAPGAQWAYSNSGYILLGAIIEKVSGQTYAEFIQQRIFGPLGMTHSHYDLPETVIPRRAAGYDKGPDGYRNTPYLSMTQPYAAGSLASSVDDLARWDAALYTGQLLLPETLARAWVGQRLSDGMDTEYGFGWFIGRYADHAFIGHGGGINGFLSSAFRLPADRVFVAVLSNNMGVDPGELAFKIAALLIDRPFEQPAPIELGGEVLAQYVGYYHSKLMPDMDITLEERQLWAQVQNGPRVALTPFAAHQFLIQERALEQLTFVRDAEGRVTGYEVRGPMGKPMTATKVEAPPGEKPV